VSEQHVFIEKVGAYSDGSCNFCSRGTWDGEAMHYPYGFVYRISGRSISVRACPECFKEIKKGAING